MTAPLILGTNSIKDEGYEVANSLRFDDGSSDYLAFTPSSETQRKIATFSAWVKRGLVDGGTPTIFEIFETSSNQVEIFFDSSERLNVSNRISNTAHNLVTTAVFRDPSAWYHIVYSLDTTQGTASNRQKLYVNGTQVTSFDEAGYMNQNTNSVFGTTNVHHVGRSQYGFDYFDGYIAELAVIDGTALDPTSFGEFDSDTNIWKPIDVSGLTFGTNGFYLDFENSGSLGADVSGNGNNFTVNNLTSIDQSTDTCTNNFATLNSLNLLNGTLSNGNTTIVTTNADSFGSSSTIGVSQGKWYVECKPTSNGSAAVIGIASDPSEDNRNNKFPGISGSSLGVGYYAANAEKFVNGTGSSYGNTWTTNDIMGIALDLDNNYIYFSKNGTWQNSGDPTSGSSGTGGISITASSSTTTGFYFFVMADGQSGAGTTLNVNFGSPPYSISSGNSDGNGYGNFEYAPPSGFYALNTKNLAEYG